MSTRFSAPLPALAGVPTRDPRTKRWWATLAPRRSAGGRSLHADSLTFTVRNEESEREATLTVQQLKGDVAIELVPGQFTASTVVVDVANGRPQKGLAKLVDRARSHRALAGASVPTSAFTRLELDLEYSPTAVEGTHGPLCSARLGLVFLVENYVCEVVVDLYRPSADDDQSLLDIADRLVADRFGQAQPLPVHEQPATAPMNGTRTLRVDLPDAVPVPLTL